MYHRILEFSVYSINTEASGKQQLIYAEHGHPNQKSPGHSYGQHWAMFYGAALGYFWLLAFCDKLHSLSARGSWESIQDGTVEWYFISLHPQLSAGLTWAAFLAPVGSCELLLWYSKWSALCVRGKEQGGQGGSWVCKTKASLWQAGHTAACKGFLDLIAQQEYPSLEHKLSPFYSLRAARMCWYGYCDSADMW